MQYEKKIPTMHTGNHSYETQRSETLPIIIFQECDEQFSPPGCKIQLREILKSHFDYSAEWIKINKGNFMMIPDQLRETITNHWPEKKFENYSITISLVDSITIMLT